jgi:hypothetical protein
MRMKELTPELYDLLRLAWTKNGHNMADGDRDLKVLDRHLFDEIDTRWYQGPGKSWIYLTNIVPGQNAAFHALNLDGWAAVDVPLVRKVMYGAMQDHDLRRMTIVLPAPLTEIAKAAKKIGFSREGRVRDGAVMNQKFVDVDIFGLLRSEIMGPPKRRRRRRRRKPWKTLAGKPVKRERHGTES